MATNDAQQQSDPAHGRVAEPTHSDIRTEVLLRLPQPVAWLMAVGAAATLGAGIWVYNVKAPKLNMVTIGLGGSDQRFPLPSGTELAVKWDFALIAGYAPALFLGIALAAAVFWTPQAKSLVRAAPWLAGAVVLADLLKDAMLWLSIHFAEPSPWLTLAVAASVMKFSCLVPAAGVAVSGFAVAIGRLLLAPRVQRRKEVMTYPPAPLEDDSVFGSRRADAATGATRWRRGFYVPDLTDKELRDAAAGKPRIGICLSGGGVRSASVALGATQSLSEELRSAKYLVSVSGGGYTAGALQLALAPPEPNPEIAGKVERVPEVLLRPGTVWEDRIRRHADYLANSTQQFLVALGVLARVMLLSLALIFSTAVIAGVAVGRAYRLAPVAPWDPSKKLHPALRDVTFPGIRTGTWWLLALLAGAAFVLYLVTLADEPRSEERNQRHDAAQATRRLSGRSGGTQPRTLAQSLQHVAANITLLALLVAGTTIVIPAVIFAAAWVLSRYGSPGTAVGGPVGALLLTWITTLASLGRRSKAGSKAKRLFAKGGTPGAAPSGLLQLILAVVTLFVLAATWLLLFGAAAAISDERSALLTAAGLLVVLAALGGMLDQTELSLHPFYRKRLATAFDARQIVRPDGYSVAVGYPYAEMTSLSTYGKKVKGFPEVIFAAAANLVGEQRAPLAAASFTFSSSWIGGPDVGYMRTEHIEDAVAENLRRDLTVEAAVAVSGAAVASAMGRASRWYGTMLAVTGVRLGTWLPNPHFIARWDAAREQNFWQLPGIPRIRRLTYLLREIFGIHQYTDRLLQITDGGHYENLGLVELLRRRCTEIYCIDASGDSPPTAGTLADAITLAQVELGVKITLLDSVWDMVPGSVATPLKPDGPLSSLNARLSEKSVIVGHISYPPESMPPESPSTTPADGSTDGGQPAIKPPTGILVVAKALLTRDLDYDLLSYAARNAVFPHDSTGDQFFDDEKFCAYSQLGREIGRKAKDAMAEEKSKLAEQAGSRTGKHEDHREPEYADLLGQVEPSQSFADLGSLPPAAFANATMPPVADQGPLLLVWLLQSAERLMSQLRLAAAGRAGSELPLEPNAINKPKRRNKRSSRQDGPPR